MGQDIVKSGNLLGQMWKLKCEYKIGVQLRGSDTPNQLYHGKRCDFQRIEWLVIATSGKCVSLLPIHFIPNFAIIGTAHSGRCRYVKPEGT